MTLTRMTLTGMTALQFEGDVARCSVAVKKREKKT